MNYILVWKFCFYLCFLFWNHYLKEFSFQAIDLHKNNFMRNNWFLLYNRVDYTKQLCSNLKNILSRDLTYSLLLILLSFPCFIKLVFPPILNFSASFFFTFLIFLFYRWVEFAKKSVAKKVANMLNGEQIGINIAYQLHWVLFTVKGGHLLWFCL